LGRAASTRHCCPAGQAGPAVNVPPSSAAGLRSSIRASSRHQEKGRKSFHQQRVPSPVLLRVPIMPSHHATCEYSRRRPSRSLLRDALSGVLP
jgi:hypothetical protein